MRVALHLRGENTDGHVARVHLVQPSGTPSQSAACRSPPIDCQQQCLCRREFRASEKPIFTRPDFETARTGRVFTNSVEAAKFRKNGQLIFPEADAVALARQSGACSTISGTRFCRSN